MYMLITIGWKQSELNQIDHYVPVNWYKVYIYAKKILELHEIYIQSAIFKYILFKKQMSIAGSD